MVRKILLAAALAVVLSGAGSGVCAQESSSGSQAGMESGFFLHQPGADDMAERPGETQESEHWLFVPAAAFVRRTSTQSLTNPSSGCVYSNGTLNADLQLPSGASVRGVRTYYYNQTSGDVVRTWLTSYDGAGSHTDHIGGDSTGSGGYTSEYFAPTTPVAVDHYTLSYVLNVRIDTNARLCGMRVFYNF